MMKSAGQPTLWLDELPEDALTILAHELRGPVQTIVGWARLLQRGVLEPNETVRALETIVRSAGVQARLIEDLLDRSRIRRGKMLLKMERVDVGSLVERVSHALLPEAQAKGIEMDLRTGETPRCVLGDPVRLEQVMRNLLTNAMKFSPKASRIEVVVTSALSKVRTSISDSGIGIRPEVLPHIFDRFRCGDGGHEEHGLGIGLAIARQIVELHGGSILAESGGQGKGARIAVVLPARDS
jgi:signal transduction histidine kinase